jgi:hypothetical protein
MAISLSETGFVEAKLKHFCCSLTCGEHCAKQETAAQLQHRNVLLFRKVSETLHLYSLAKETMQSPTRLDGMFLKHSGTFETSEHFCVAHERFSRVAADQLDA